MPLPKPDPSPERFSLAVITDDADIFPEIRKNLGGEFRTSLATTKDEIRDVVERDDIHAILFSLEAIGEGFADGLEVLQEIRRIRDDVVLAAFTRGNQRTLPLKASQAGADEFFPFPSITTS